MLRYGKSAEALLAHKQAFFTDNQEILAQEETLAALYLQQPQRTLCKCCAMALEQPTFCKRGINYHLCARCGHLSGAHEDSDAFCAQLYTEDQGQSYAKNYGSADRTAYQRRVVDIYQPKAQFLRDALTQSTDTPEALHFTDFGAGSGYFVAALRAVGLQESYGYEVSEAQLSLGRAMLDPDALIGHSLDDTVELAREVQTDVVSMIGVLEHVQQPREIVAALRANKNVRFLYLSVPLFSPCVFFEMIFPQVFHRQLSAGHTHLFTDNSLAWLCTEFGMQRRAEWWFGTDIVDWFRSVFVTLEQQSASPEVTSMWSEVMTPAIDDMQLALDQRKLSSEVHLLLEFSE
jgi:hypothetical protein